MQQFEVWNSFINVAFGNDGVPAMFKQGVDTKHIDAANFSDYTPSPSAVQRRATKVNRKSAANYLFWCMVQKLGIICD